MHDSLNKKRGIAFIAVLITMLLLIALVGAFLALITNARLLNARYDENLATLGLAEAGVDYAIWEMNFGGNDFSSADGWSGGNPKAKTINNFQDTEGNVYGNISVKVYNPGTDEVTVISEGSLSSITGPIVDRAIRVVLERHMLFNYAILTSDDIDIGGNAIVDSYNSSLGAYGGTNIGSNGDLITNGQDAAAIELHGSVVVQGGAVTGPDGTVSIIGSASLSGGTDDDAEILIPPVKVPSELDVASLGDIKLTGTQSMQLDTGNYTYDSVDLKGSSTLILDGDVGLYLVESPSLKTAGSSQIIVTNGTSDIYYNGTVDIAGQGVLNEGGDPSGLGLFGTGNATSVSLSGVGEFYGTIYAPNASIAIAGNSAVYGSAVGKSLSLDGTAQFHYDEQLRTDGDSSGYDPALWQEK